MSLNEADTCRKLVTPKLQAAGWDSEPHSIGEQRTITDGRIIPAGQRYKRKAPKRVDYLLSYRRDFQIAVVEAKTIHAPAAEGLQQAKDYAEMLGLKFAYATNGVEIIEYDYATGLDSRLSEFPTPDALWRRYCKAAGVETPETAGRLLTPYRIEPKKEPRYYQTIAINRAVEDILKGRDKLLLTMATGSGKTTVAFQICWKLWSSRWNRKGEHRKPKILVLADRSVLVNDPMTKDFAPLKDAIHKIGDGEVTLGREMYFGLYQSLAEDERREGRFRQFPPDFFDLVIIDECHRGSARNDSSWRVILDYFTGAAKLGMTATPKRDDNADTYAYFGDPIYTYSLKQGIEDGFLAPYRVHRVISEWDAAGWRPTKDQIDRFGRAVPDEEYQTKDFEKVIALRARTQAIAKHLTEFMAKTGRFAKTIVFCVDQEHALEMAQALGNLNADLRREHPDYVCRVTADEGAVGIQHLWNFQDPDNDTPVILTTSQLLTTGVDAPTIRNVVLARVVGSMSEFKQIIGRGTRVKSEYDKLWFNIIDYTGAATAKFADPEFDGEPVREDETRIDEEGKVDSLPAQEEDDAPSLPGYEEEGTGEVIEPDGGPPRKFYVDGGHVRIINHVVQELDPNGHVLRTTRYEDYAADKVRVLCPTVFDLKNRWADPIQRGEIIARLKDEAVEFDALAEALNQPEADPFDLLCHLAFNAPLRTRRERAQRLKSERKDFFEAYGPAARQILADLLDKYADHGDAQFALPEVLHVAPISNYGTVTEIARAFGGADKLRQAVSELQTLLYQESV
jgi:type I restriction enzyme R subunit